MAIIKHSRTNKTSKKKTIFYEAQVYVRGVRVATKTFETQAEAAVWHDEAKKKSLSGQITHEEVGNMLFGTVLQKYRQERLSELRPQSRQTAEIRVKYLAKAPIANHRMCDISDTVIDDWFRWLKKQPTTKNKGRKHFRQEFKLLSAVLNWYRDCINALFVVPIVKRHRQAIFYKPVTPRRPDYFMRKEDIQSWISWLKVHRRNPTYYRLASFMVLTATRVGEAAGVCWDTVDFDNKIVSIRRSVWWDHLTRRPNLQELTKTAESVRIIGLSPPVLEMLREMRQESSGVGPVFTDREGGILGYSAIQHSFNAGFEALNLPWRSTHICRHSFGTLALVATRDLSSVQAAMGHRNIRETQGYAKIAALLDGVAATKTAEYINLSI